MIFLESFMLIPRMHPLLKILFEFLFGITFG